MRLFLIIIMLITIAFSFKQALANKHQCIEAVSNETTAPEQTCQCLFDEAANNSALQAEIIGADGIPSEQERSEALKDSIKACAET